MNTVELIYTSSQKQDIRPSIEISECHQTRNDIHFPHTEDSVLQRQMFVLF